MKLEVEGLKALDKALGELTKTAGKAALRRAGKAALEPMARAARIAAPRDEGDLAEGIDVSTKLSRRQKGLHRKRDAVEIFMGPSADDTGAAINQEFGNENHPPQPFMRPTWDGGKRRLWEDLKFEMAFEIDKSVKRAARKAANNAG